MATWRSLSNLALAMMALPALLGLCLCYVRPEQAWLGAIAMISAPALWLGVRAASKVFGGVTLSEILIGTEKSAEARNALSWAMIFLCWVVVLCVGAKLADALGLIGHSLANAIAVRWTNALVGGYLVLKGNRLPKILTPLSGLRCDAAALQTLQRRIGWSFVLTGLVYAVLWFSLPPHLAELIGPPVVLVGIWGPCIILRSFVKGRLGIADR